MSPQHAAAFAAEMRMMQSRLAQAEAKLALAQQREQR
jgi:hypothetical protein